MILIVVTLLAAHTFPLAGRILLMKRYYPSGLPADLGVAVFVTWNMAYPS
jgi:hypothetical protein